MDRVTVRRRNKFGVFQRLWASNLTDLIDFAFKVNTLAVMKGYAFRFLGKLLRVKRNGLAILDLLFASRNQIEIFLGDCKNHMGSKMTHIGLSVTCNRRHEEFLDTRPILRLFDSIKPDANCVVGDFVSMHMLSILEPSQGEVDIGFSQFHIYPVEPGMHFKRFKSFYSFHKQEYRIEKLESNGIEVEITTRRGGRQ